MTATQLGEAWLQPASVSCQLIQYATYPQRYGFISGLEAFVVQGTLESGHKPNPCFQAHQRAFGRIVVRPDATDALVNIARSP